MDNKTKIDRIHDLLPKVFNSKHNPNWNAMVSALGDVDQQLADLVTEVRKQLFVETASSPYLDRLGAGVKVARPQFTGMDDPTFRKFIPVMSYQPKQVKMIIDALLDIFFFKESTTAYVTSQNASPYTLQDGWELSYLIDEINEEDIILYASDFTNITAATAEEVVSAINRQAKYSYATAFYDHITKGTYVRLFTNTIGSKGSIQFVGGRTLPAMRFNGFLDTAGNGSNTRWTVTKIGDTVTYQYSGGGSPGLNNVRIGDVVIINMLGNIGSFPISNVDISDNNFSFSNLFATPGNFTETNADQVKFIRPNKYAAYLNDRRAMTWETTPGEVEVEMPASPPVVKRSLKGSAHINGSVSIMLNRVSDSSLTLADATEFPNSGSFVIEKVDEVDVLWATPSENTVSSVQVGSRLQNTPQKYVYTSRTVLSTYGDIQENSNQIKNLVSTIGLAIGQTVFADGIRGDAVVTDISAGVVTISTNSTLTANGMPINFGGNTLTGITPALPITSSLNEITISSLQRDSNNTGIATTTTPHGYSVGEYAIVSGTAGEVDTLSGTWIITEVISPTSFGFFSYGRNTGGPIVTPGSARVERLAMANSGSKIILTNSISSDITRIKGAYLWDPKAPFVLSANTTAIQDVIKAGKIVKILSIGPNTIPDQDGFVVFDYGLNTQEGPVRYLYKPTATTLAIDPSYMFLFDHSVDSGVVSIDHKGPHVISTTAAEYAPYITDPSQARIVLENLIDSVKSAGIFVNFIIRYPEQLYGMLDVYNENSKGAGEPL